jgi:hypothetical protein
MRNVPAAFSTIQFRQLLRPLVGIVLAHFCAPAIRRAIRVRHIREEVCFDRSCGA